MSPDSTRDSEDKNAAQQRFLSPFLRSEREIFRYVAALVPNVVDAGDIVQQTALALWEKFHAYDPNQPFTPWACRFALNKTKQWIERRQRWQALLEGGLVEELAQRRDELRPRFETRLKHLDGCLNKLPADQRSIVEGYYYRRDGARNSALHRPDVSTEDVRLSRHREHGRPVPSVNVIVFKVVNEQNSWQGAMRLLDKSGAPLKDIKIKLSP